MCHSGELSCRAKLVRVVLDHRGPLTPREVATEGHLGRTDAREALAELREIGYVRSVCGLRETREELYELTEAGRERDQATV